VPGVDDAAEYKETVNAMNIMGMTTEDYSGMFNYKYDIYMYICGLINKFLF